MEKLPNKLPQPTASTSLVTPFNSPLIDFYDSNFPILLIITFAIFLNVLAQLARTRIVQTRKEK